MTSDRVDRHQPWRRIGRGLIVLAVLAIGARWVATGVFFVETDERAVVFRLGRVVDPQVSPGLHLTWPLPVGRVVIVNIQNRRLTVGLDPQTRAAIAAGDVVARATSTATDVFTGDTNIVKVTLVAGYQVTAVDRFVTRVRDGDELVRVAVQSAMVEVMGGYSVDDALTAGKIAIQDEIARTAQALLDEVVCGVKLTAVNVESIEPPYAINDAFRDVASAKKDREKNIDQARSFANAILPTAQARAFEITSQAESHRTRRLSEAHSTADRFRVLHGEYVKVPEVTRSRMIRDTLTRVIQRSQTYLVSPNEEGPPLQITITD